MIEPLKKTKQAWLKPVTLLLFIISIFTLAGPRAIADAEVKAEDFSKFGLSLGVFVTNRDSKARLDGSIGDDGTEVDLENGFGLKKSDSVFRVDGYYRFADKHRIDFSVFDLSRSSKKMIDTEIEWADQIYPINATVKFDLDLTIYKLAYTYSFLQREKGYLGVTAGLYVSDIGTALSLQPVGASSKSDVTAPLPVLGLRGEYQLADKWVLRGSGEIFAIDYGDYSGSLTDLYVGIDHQLFKNTDIGIGYNLVNFKLDVEKTNFNGRLDWQYDGGLLFVKFNF